MCCSMMNCMGVIDSKTVCLARLAVLTLRLLITLERCGTTLGKYAQETFQTFLKPEVTGQNIPPTHTIGLPGVKVG